MLKAEQLFLSDGTKVGVTMRHSADGRPYWVYKRRGYPPVVRRRLLDAPDLERAYRNDNHIKLRGLGHGKDTDTSSTATSN